MLLPVTRLLLLVTSAVTISLLRGLSLRHYCLLLRDEPLLCDVVTAITAYY